MQREQNHAILAIAIHAAFADGAKDEREREAVRRVARKIWRVQKVRPIFPVCIRMCCSSARPWPTPQRY